MVVDAGVIDDGANTESLASIGLGRKFAAQPSNCCRFQFFIASFMSLPIPADNLREVEASCQLLEMGKALANDVICRLFLRLGIVLGLADKAFDHIRQCTTIWLGPGGKISRHLRVEAPCLPAGRVDASIRGKVGKHDDQSLFERHKPDQVHEEGLAGAILADDETNG